MTEKDESKNTNTVKSYFAPGSVAEHAQGVLYQGDYQNEFDGTGIAVRLHARALAGTGLPVLVRPFSSVVMAQKGTHEPLHVVGISDSVREEVGDLPNTSISSLFPYIRHFVVHKAEDISKRIMRGSVGPLDDPETLMNARKAVYGSSVLYSVWERDRINDQMVRELRRLGDNWVPCSQNSEMLKHCGVQNVAVIPHPYDPKNPILHLTRRKPMKTKRFYFIGRWEPRKNPVLLLEKFFSVFKPGDDVHLTMKTHGRWEGYPTFEQTIAHVQEDHPEWTREAIDKHVTHIEGFLRQDQIVKLHFDNNIYVAPSAGEAWCLPAFEAKLAGNRLIHVPYGGTEDFAIETDDIAVQYDMGPVPNSYGWPPGSEWAHVSERDLEAALREFDAPQEYVRPADFEERFSLAAVGSLMRARLVEVFGSTKRGGYLK